LNLPALGQEVALIAWQYPAYRNVTLRLLEPLGAIEQQPARASVDSVRLDAPVSIAFQNVGVVAAGHQVLHDINLSIPAGSHVAIVGASGAGKSSLVWLLLGWHRAASGRVLVDEIALDESRLDRLRARTAWVDPAVQLWNRPLAENLRYGSPENARIDEVLDAAELHHVIERLPNGLETPLGEGGGLVSGGEGQRVRLGRALLRSNVRLVILDEPFRGLDSEQRHVLLTRARGVWRDATLIFISHDIQEAMSFDRVLVMEHGTIVEDGHGPRLRAMLDAERALREEFWEGADWRRLRLDDGHLTS
jgi:ATP-binding cassette subfamily B protein